MGDEDLPVAGGRGADPDGRAADFGGDFSREVLRHAFDDLGVRRLEWKCDALNEPSRRAAKRFGFQFEGIFRQHFIIKGRNRDTAWFAMIDKDWPKVRAGFEAWLA